MSDVYEELSFISTKRKLFKWVSTNDLLKGAVYKENRIKPRTEPWGTSYKSLLNSENVEPILIHWQWSMR